MKKFIITALACIIIITSCPAKSENKVVDKTSSTHEATTAEIFTTPKVQINTVGIYGYSSLDTMGPYFVFTQPLGPEVFFIAKHKGIVEDVVGLKVEVDNTIDEVKHLDVLLISSDLAQTYHEINHASLFSWVRSIDTTSKYTTRQDKGLSNRVKNYITITGLQDPILEAESPNCTIPFTKIGKLILVKGKVDSTEGNFVLETGAPF